MCSTLPSGRTPQLKDCAAQIETLHESAKSLMAQVETSRARPRRVDRFLHEWKAADSVPSGHFVIFLPFLRMRTGHTVAGVEFLPLRDGDGNVPAALETVVAPLEKILSGYVDRQRSPFTNCVVATIPGKGWDLSRDDSSAVMWGASLLFLASWACNDYFPRIRGPYVNSAMFRIIGQAYSGDMPGHIGISARRRDGETLGGGYKHGEVTFNVPVQCSIRETAVFDEDFLAGLSAADAADSAVAGLLRTSLPFVELANTDDDFMTEHAEAILMGSAFEQLLRGDASKYKLGQRLAELFDQFGAVTVADAQKVRAGITIDDSDAERAAAQPKWWVHQKWIEELYDMRSKVAHKGSYGGRTWGWTIFEHLVMAAYVFPLAVKLLLEREGHYALTDTDRGGCRAVDQLLACAKWVEDEVARESQESWTSIRSRVKQDLLIRNFLDKHPEWFSDAGEFDVQLDG